MRYYSQYLYDLKEFLVLFLCIFISLLLIYSNDNDYINSIKVTALQGRGFLRQHLFITPEFSEKRKLEEQVQFLRIQNTRLALETSGMRNAIVENQRLRQLISFIRESDYSFTVARVLSVDKMGFMNQLILDVGKDQSMEKGMPIVLPEGMIGRIYEVTDDYSIGQLLFDKNFRISVKILRNNVKGILTWEEGNTMLMTQVANRADILVADSVVTSGFSRIFPEGIYVGRVTAAENSRRSLFMDIRVKPDVDVSQLEEVLILTSHDRKNQVAE
ncbi:rod shape-determining protein MreC [candidate division KSB1 bacterium]|nr:rod shape-determining protein MreC [candidate division KSB1 bacterium]